MSKLHTYIVGDGNISNIYDKIKKLLEGNNVRIDEISNPRLVNKISFYKKRDMSNPFIRIVWQVEAENRNIEIWTGDRVELKGTRELLIKHKSREYKKVLTNFFVVNRLPKENPVTH